MRARRTAAWFLAPLGGLALGLLGCSGFDHLDFRYRSAPVDNGSVSYWRIRIHEATAVGVVATPMDGNEPMDETTTVGLEPDDPGVLGIARAEPGDAQEDDEVNRSFVLFGVRAGATDVRVIIDGDVEGTIPATIEAQ
jgi:hypothetical protein